MINERQPIDADRARLIEANFIDVARSWVGPSGGECVDRADLFLYATGILHPLFNGVFRSHFIEGTVEARTDEVITFFRRRKLPFLWCIGPSTIPEDMAHILGVSGLTPVSVCTGMSVDLDRLESLSGGGAFIRPVEDDVSLAQWVRVFRVSFGLPQDSEKDCMRIFRSGDFSFPWRHYLAYAGDEIAGISSVFFTGESAGIYNVATLPSFRGRGIGRSMTLVPLLYAREKGYRTGVLGATEMGFNIYRKLGFERHTVLTFYSAEEGWEWDKEDRHSD